MQIVFFISDGIIDSTVRERVCRAACCRVFAVTPMPLLHGLCRCGS
jgi:hypothetical protein